MLYYNDDSEDDTGAIVPIYVFRSTLQILLIENLKKHDIEYPYKIVNSILHSLFNNKNDEKVL